MFPASGQFSATVTTTILIFSVIIFIALAYISSIRFGTSTLSFNNSTNTNLSHKLPHKHPINTTRKIEIPLNCSFGNQKKITCPTNYPKTFETEDDSVCPDYFRWIHEDLRPWKTKGITRDMLDKTKRPAGPAHFRIVIVEGKAYMEKYDNAFQTRDVFTIWGILQLLRRYPGRVPDLELVFNCDDPPNIKSYFGQTAPPLFHYCGDSSSMDIVFPDWSFWGWIEINIKPWESLLKDLKEGNNRTKWVEREPYAFWKGNPTVAATRKNLLTCNVSDKQDWNARLYAQDWVRASRQGYKQSNLEDQCTHRYKIYIEGRAWSVSEKYILGCDSVTLLVKPRYYDFFTRGLQPLLHYWPIRDNDKCKSIKFATEWGNQNKQKAQAIGKAGSDFIQEELKMDYVYDYMFHVLSEYSKLLKFKPTIPQGAVELCSESMACAANGIQKEFMMASLVKGPSLTSPCAMPPPYEPRDLKNLNRRNDNLLSKVEKWEKKYWESMSDTY